MGSKHFYVGTANAYTALHLMREPSSQNIEKFLEHRF